MTPIPAVDVQGVSKRYAGHTAVRDLTLNVPRGSIYGLLGPNGAGKTTTIRMIMGIVRPDEGQITVLGDTGGGWAVNERIGYLPEERGLYRRMRVQDLLVFLAEAKGMRRSEAKRDAGAWLERLGLDAWRLRKVDDLSKGMQQKVQFIATVLHRPDIVILDEPFAGLDPVNSQVLKDTVRDLSRGGTTILFSTHVMEQAERLCDSVCIIAGGAKVLDGTLAEVKQSHGGRHVVVAVADGLGAIESLLADRGVVARSDAYGSYAELEVAEGVEPQVLLERLVRSGARVTRFEVTEASLHKIFIDRVGAEAAVVPASGQVAVRKIWVIMRREFLERVRTRWFVITTILGPVFMAALLILPLVVSGSGARERSIVVMDVTTEGFGERLTADLERSQPFRATRVPAEVVELESVADSLARLVAAKAFDGFLIVSDATLQDGQAEYRGTNVSSPRDMQMLSRYLEESALTERLTRAGVNPEAVRRARLDVRIRTTKVTGARGAMESGEGSFVLAYVMWFVLYIAIIVYGVSVMGSVVEEKTSRVIEVLVSSVRPFQLLAGKVLGVGGVGLFQLSIWALCGTVLIDRQKEIMQLLHLTPEASAPGLPHIPLVTGIIFLLYFLLGYFLYAAMFAAVASMSSTEAEARQAQTPVVMLLVVPSVLMIGILNDPGGTLAVTLGMVPFFSPIAMPVRWAAAPVPGGQLVASLGILVLTLPGGDWVASRIYRVGILMYGKRPSLREVIRWVRAAGPNTPASPHL